MQVTRQHLLKGQYQLRDKRNSLNFTPKETFESQGIRSIFQAPTCLSNHVSEIGKIVDEGQESLHFLIWQMRRNIFNLLLESVDSTGMTRSLIASVFPQTSILGILFMPWVYMEITNK